MAAIIRLWYFQNLSEGIDGVMYLTIAERYHFGKFYEAINGVWSPLVCWLLAPFLFIKTKQFLLFGCLNILAGLFTFIACIQLIKKIQLTRLLEGIFIFSCIPLIIYFSMEQTPDLLYLAILFFYLNILTGKNYFQNKWSGHSAGALGALLYFSQSFGFPFFLTHFSVIHGFYFFGKKQDGKTIIKKFLTGITIFFIIASCWIGALYYKYNFLTICTVKDYNFSLMNPMDVKREEIEQNLNHQLVYNGLTAPPYQYAINGWEEVTIVNNKPLPWNKFESVNNFVHYLFIIKKNVKSIFYDDLTRDTCVFLLLSFLFVFYKKIKMKSDDMTLLIIWLLTAGIHTFGYTLVLVVPRFLWMVIIIFILSFAINLKYLHNDKEFKKLTVVVAVFFLLFISYKSWQEIKSFSMPNDNSNKVFLSVKKIETKEKVHGNIASYSNDKILEHYLGTLQFCYFLKCKYFGNITDKIIKEEGWNSLEKYKIDYLFVWDFANMPIDSTYQAKVFEDTSLNLIVYTKPN